MTTTFTCFWALAPELRALVWEAACRNTRIPGAHFLMNGHLDILSIYRRRADSDSSNEASSSHQEVETPIHDPRSTYTVGWGVWNACRESRAVFLRLYGNRWAEIRQGKFWDIGPGFAVDAQLAAQTQLRPRLPGQHPMVVLPEQDLFIISATHNRNPLNMMTLTTLKRVLAGTKVSHVGIVFDPEDRDSIRLVEDCRVLNCPHVCPRVWLIYSGLHHVFGTVPPNRQVFEGVNCRFTEVSAEDPGWADAGWPSTDPSGIGVRQWVQDTNARWPVPMCTDCPEHHRPRQKVGLLAYEAL